MCGFQVSRVSAGGIFIFEAGDGPQTTLVKIHCSWGFWGIIKKKHPTVGVCFFVVFVFFLLLLQRALSELWAKEE